MSDYHINVFYGDEDAAYVADIPDLEACSALGGSPEEALAEVERAKDGRVRLASQSPSHAIDPRSTRVSCRRMLVPAGAVKLPHQA
jgi:predicted RNase H-like HicB family nuclease